MNFCLSFLSLSLYIYIYIYNRLWMGSQSFHFPRSKPSLISLSLSTFPHPSLSLQWIPCHSDQHPSPKQWYFFLSLSLSLSFIVSGNCLSGLIEWWFSDVPRVVFRSSDSPMFLPLIYLLLFCFGNLYVYVGIVLYIYHPHTYHSTYDFVIFSVGFQFCFWILKCFF